jgi:hypothetical protein
MKLSVHRVALGTATAVAIASFAAFVVVGGQLTAQHAASAAAAAVSTTTTVAARGTSPAAVPAPQTVYVRPAPSPQVIQVSQTAPPVPPTVVTVTVPSAGGENDDDAHEVNG